MTKLAPKQRRFADEYLMDLSATKAAVRAGYSGRTAYSLGQRLLKNVEVKTEIDRLMSERSKRTEITADRVLRELSYIAFFDPIHLFGTDGGFLPLGKLPEETRRAISGVDFVVEGGRGMAVKKIKLADKLRALEMLGRHLGLWDGDKKQVETEDPLTALLMHCQGSALVPNPAAGRPRKDDDDDDTRH